MEDFPWFYLVLILFAFVSWLHNRIREAVEYRRRRAEARREAAEARRSAKPSPAPSPYHRPVAEPAPPSAPPRPAPRPAPTAEIPEAPRTFREFLELLREATEPEPESVERPATVAPPPLPTAAPAPKPPNPAPVEAGTSSPSPARRAGLVTALGRRGSLRQAIVLKEVLEEPVSLRRDSF